MTDPRMHRAKQGPTRVRMEAGQNGLRDGRTEGAAGDPPAAARKWNAPFPVSPSGGKPGRAGSPHAGTRLVPANYAVTIRAPAPPARGISKRSAEIPLAHPPVSLRQQGIL